MKYFLLLVCLQLLLLNSCTTQMYVSNAVNAPLLKEKHEVKVNVTQNDLQVSAAINRNFALMANGFYKNYKGDNGYEHRGGLGEFGAGYYTSNRKHLLFEAFMGVGFGNVYKQQRFAHINESDVMGHFSANATKLFIQPDVGYCSRFVDIAFSPRFSFVKYTRLSHQNYPASELQNDYLTDRNLTGPVFIFSEPAITLRGGYKFIKLQLQYGLTLNVTGRKIKHPGNFSSVGLVIDIAKWYNNQ